MFESVAIYLNGVCVNKNCARYPYRAYINKLLSYPKDAKTSWMQGEGWYEDQLEKFDPSTYSTGGDGFKQRRELFMTRTDDIADPTNYNTNFIPMFGKIYSDINNINTGILPGIKVTVNMEFSKDPFRIVAKDGQDYTIEISKVILHMPLAAVNPNMFRSIEAKLAKEAAKIFYKRFELSTFTINSSSQSFSQIINTSTGSGASRMFVAFVTLRSFKGSYQLNPFKFARRWGWTEKNAANETVEHSCWIQRVDLTLNGKPLDCMNADATEFDDQVAFLRMNQTLGYSSTPSSNNINYRDFCTNSAIYIFDLTISGRSGQVSDVFSPIVKTGDTRLDVTFGGDPTNTEMKVMVFSEFPSLFTIKKDRELNFSYFPAVA